MSEGSPRDGGDSWVAFGRRRFSAAALALLSGAAACEADTLAAGTRPGLYVSSTGSDSNNGSRRAPFPSILAPPPHAPPRTTPPVPAGTPAGGLTPAGPPTPAPPLPP